MFCPNCGSAVREGAKFCASCGHPLATQQSAPSPVQAQPTGAFPAVPAPAAPTPDAVSDETVLSSHSPATPTPTGAFAAAPAPSAPAPAPVPAAPTVPATPAASPVGQPTGAIPVPQIPLPQGSATAPTQPTGAFPAVPAPAPIPSQPQATVATGMPKPSPAATPAAQSTPTMPTGPIPTPPAAAAASAQPGAPAPSAPAVPAAANPLVKELISPGNMQTIGASVGIGVIAAIVLSVFPAIALNSLGSGTNFGSGSILSSVNDMLQITNGINFFHYLVLSLVIGLAGGSSINMNSSALTNYASQLTGIDLSNLNVSNLISYPLGLTGVALVIGTAYGAYMVARMKSVRFKLTGLISGIIAGLVSALVVTLIAAIGQAPIVSSNIIVAHLSGATWRTFLTTFVLGTLGSLTGYALAQYVSDSKTVFQAFWQWLHRSRGFVRSTAEVLVLQLALFFVTAIVALFVLTFKSGQGMILMTFPISMMFIGEMFFTFSTFGSLSVVQDTNQLPVSASLFSPDLGMPVWPIWLLFVLFLLITALTALRASARNMYDPAYMGCQHIWKMPVAVMVFWLLANTIFGTIGFDLSMRDMHISIAPAMWNFFIMGIWAVLVEIVAMTFGPTIVVSVPALWPALVGGTVRATPQPVVDYIYASGAMFGKWPTWGTPSEGVTARPFDDGPNPPSATGGPANGPASGPTNGPASGPINGPVPPTAPAAPATPTAAAGTATFTAAPAAAPTSIPASPVAAPAAPGVPGSTPAAATTTMTAQQKKIAIIAGAVVGFVVLFSIVYGVLSSSVFSAKSVANSYISAIQSGDFDKANDIAKPAVDQDKAALLTDKASEGENTRITNARITQTTTNADGSVTAQLSYTLGGKEVTSDSIKMVTNGGKFLIFKNWTVAEPLVKTIKVSMPGSLDSVVVNGVTVSAKNSTSGSDSSSSYSYLEFPVYPGTYKVTAPQSEYYSSSTVSASTNADSSDTLKLTSTDKLKSAIDKEVKSATDKCAASTEAEPEGCPFGYSSYYSTSRYRNFKWKVKNYATVDDIDMSSSTFSTKEGDVTMNYEYHSSDGWEPDDGSRSFTANGHFTIADGKVSISFAN